MMTTWRSRMVLALAAATFVTMFATTPGFGDDRNKNRDNRGQTVRDSDRNHDRDRDRDYDRDRDRGPDRKWDSGDKRGARPGWYSRPTIYYYPPIVYCQPVRVVSPRYQTVVVCRPAPVYCSFGLWFGW